MTGSEVPGRVRFCVLGPLAVLRDGEPVRLGGERQRALLALLLVRANQLVSVEQLVEQLFGGERSDAAVNAVRVAVSRLRRALEDGAGAAGVVQTRAGGYVLATGREQVDADRFERLSADGQRLLAIGDPGSAALKLREALGLWRGAPLADLALFEPVQAEIRRWEELRRLALMGRVDADLALGGGVELIAEIESLVASNPLQERLRGQLMLALYRAGRQADALTVYRRTSELLRDELGLEPSRSLRELERSILQHDPTLDPPKRPAADPARRTGLFEPATPLVGRVQELAELTTLLRRDDTRLLTLTGAGGSGKTRLAIRLADACASEYRDGVWFVGFADITDPELIAPTICLALGLSDASDVMPARRVEEWLATRRVLLVLDNLEQLLDGTGVLSELLASSRESTLLVTSREPLHLAAERQYAVPVLTSADAIELFTVRAEAIVPGLHPDRALAARICDRLDRLPLAIELAAARTKALSSGELLARLDDRLPLLTGGPRDAPERQHTLRATINWSYHLLTAEQQRLFARLSVFAGGWTLPAAEAVCGADLDTLQALVDRSLVRRDGERYSMLQTLGEYALERLERAGDAQALRRAHAGWLIELLEVERLRPPGRPTVSSLKRVLPELENFRAALNWAHGGGATPTVAQLASPLIGVLITNGQLHEAERWMTLVLEHAHEYPPPLAAQVWSAARALAFNTGDHVKMVTFANRALALWQEIGDTEAIAREMMSPGLAAELAGDLTVARASFERGVEFARENALPDTLAFGLNNLGYVAIREGNLSDGRSLCEESVALAPPGSQWQSIALINLAHIAMLEGDPTEADQFARQALADSLQRSDLLCLASAAIELSWPLAEQGELEGAAKLLGAGFGFLDASGEPPDVMDNVCEDAVRTVLCAHVGERAAQSLINQGRRMPLERLARDVVSRPRVMHRSDTEPRGRPAERLPRGT